VAAGGSGALAERSLVELASGAGDTIDGVGWGTAVTRDNVWVSSFNGKILVMDFEGRPIGTESDFPFREKLTGLMGIGAIFGAVNTMYNAVASRSREIATLRALGFGSLPVVISVLAEAVALSAIGGIIGGLLAWVAFDGYQTSTMNFQSFSQVAFAFAVTPSLLAAALAYAIIMGLAGGLLPAVRAARLPIVTALRQL